MICKICNRVKYGFTRHHHQWVMPNRIDHLVDICFDCFNLAPKHIPDKQIEKWLRSGK